jgi:hypothetical protein
MQTDTGNNRSGAWNMGSLARRRNFRSGESLNILTGAGWDGGMASKNRTGVASISETIGGNDMTDWARFRANVPVQINLVTNTAITAIVNSSRNTVVDSSNLTTFCSRESILSSSAPSLLLLLCLPRN